MIDNEELRQQRRDYRADMENFGRQPSKLEAVGPMAIEHQGDDQATVMEQVHAVCWDGSHLLTGDAHPWRWELRKDDGGGRVWSVELPSWCGVHVRPELCRR
ncbi:hypothetical protein ACWEH1_21565 [Micromonospora chersina]